MNGPDPDEDYRAVGAAADVFDAPAVFYLTHADAIERWHQLRDTAIDATSAFLDTVIEEYEPPARISTWSVTTADTRGDYRHMLLAPTNCPTAAGDIPEIAVVFGWNTKRVSITPGGYSPFVGVRVASGKPKTSAWREEFLRGPGSEATNIRGRRGYRARGEWPAWRPVTATGRWWQELDTYRESIDTELANCLTDFADEIERTVTSRV